MSQIVGILVLLLLSLAPLSVALVLAFRQFSRKTQKPKLLRPLLRSPGVRLRDRINSLQLDLSLYLGLLCSIGPFSGLLILIQAYFSERVLGTWDFSIFVLCTVGLSSLALYKYFKIKNQIHSVLSDLECELAVGQELDQLQRQGYHVFHDVPCDGFNIDHVVVGRNGIFAVETKSRIKPNYDSANGEFRITVDNKGVNIPVRHGIIKDSASVEQAMNQSEWLSRLLSASMQEKISVTPMLVFPGWTVANYNDDHISVFNEKQLRTELPKLKAQRLADANVSKIAHLLDLRVRDVGEETSVNPEQQKAA